ncbi:hypothetical protein KKH13_04865, partial [Patescibacteria group bacterium]|nr:hypothetical protein [Patescibacteria group bacterium]
MSVKVDNIGVGVDAGDLRYLKLDQSTPQDISNGQPDFLAGLRAGSTNQLSMDASGNLTTTGTINIGADSVNLTMGVAGATDYYQQFDGTDSQFYCSGNFHINLAGATARSSNARFLVEGKSRTGSSNSLFVVNHLT